MVYVTVKTWITCVSMSSYNSSRLLQLQNIGGRRGKIIISVRLMSHAPLAMLFP